MPECELTILMPCLNEAETLAICIEKAQRYLRESGITGEVLISDNGSTDGSQEIAERLGARVSHAPIRGYGGALINGIREARGKYIIMGDSDDSYDFSSLDPFVEKLREGYDLVMGNRFQGGIMKGAMPPLHQYLGNPLLSGIGKLFFKTSCSDFHCGLRGFSKQAALAMDLRSPGMEFASEMVIKATLLKMRIAEVPIVLHPDGRSRPPHLRSWSDGWRHLRFMLLYCPRWLFLIPGIVLFLIGLLGFACVATGPKVIGTVVFEVNTMVTFAFLMIIGSQLLQFSIYSRVYGMNSGYLPKNQRLMQLSRIVTLEKAILLGIVLCLIGGIGMIAFFVSWSSTGAGALDTFSSLRNSLIYLLCFYFGMTCIFSGFFLSTLGIKNDYWKKE